MKKHKISQRQFDLLSAKLDRLKNVKRKTLNEAWRLAVAEGDDRETDAITVSFNLIRSNEQEIVDLENVLLDAEIIQKIDRDRVEIGSRVRLRLDGEDKDFIMSDPLEADPDRNLLSVETPIGVAIHGKRAGYRTSVTLPDGSERKIEVLSIE